LRRLFLEAIFLIVYGRPLEKLGEQTYW